MGFFGNIWKGIVGWYEFNIQMAKFIILLVILLVILVIYGIYKGISKLRNKLKFQPYVENFV